MKKQRWFVRNEDNDKSNNDFNFEKIIVQTIYNQYLIGIKKSIKNNKNNNNYNNNSDNNETNKRRKDDNLCISKATIKLVATRI